MAESKAKEFVPMMFPAPEPRYLSDEFGELMPLLGGLAREQSSIDIAGAKELTSFQGEYAMEFFRNYYREIARTTCKSRRRATADT